MTASTLPSELSVPGDRDKIDALWSAHNIVGMRAASAQERAAGDVDQTPPIDQVSSYRMVALSLLLSSPKRIVNKSKLHQTLVLRDGFIDADLLEHIWQDLCQLVEILNRPEPADLGDLLSRWGPPA